LGILIFSFLGATARRKRLCDDRPKSRAEKSVENTPEKRNNDALYRGPLSNANFGLPFDLAQDKRIAEWLARGHDALSNPAASGRLSSFVKAFFGEGDPRVRKEQ